MTKSFMSFLQSSPGLVRVSDLKEPASVNEVVARILEIAELDETELAKLMGTPMGGSLARFVVPNEAVESEDLLSDWDHIGHASPVELTTLEYDRFLHGEVPASRDDAAVTPLDELDPKHSQR
jgi:hypothetical protein